MTDGCDQSESNAAKTKEEARLADFAFMTQVASEQIWILRLNRNLLNWLEQQTGVRCIGS